MSRLGDTSDRLRKLDLTRATLLVDERRARSNIDRFAARARTAGVALRPHFKTHQSADVARWFRDAGVDRATVSSLGQALYFADHGWDDLVLAMGANSLEIADYSALAARIRLGLLADNAATVAALAAELAHPVQLWLDVDVGHGRTGVPWQDGERLAALAGQVDRSPMLRLAGLLTHAGQSYRCRDAAEAAAGFAQMLQRLRSCREALATAGFDGLLLSAGDTPGFAAAADWSGLDEARPGNFVFFDLMQLEAGACTAGDLACAVACPVIGVYPDREQVVVHAGAVHLSREFLGTGDDTCYGRLLTLDREGFATVPEGWSVVGLSQEHAVLKAGDGVARTELRSLCPGDLLLIAPVHSCLTCEQFASYRTLEGARLERYRRD